MISVNALTTSPTDPRPSSLSPPPRIPSSHLMAFVGTPLRTKLTFPKSNYLSSPLQNTSTNLRHRRSSLVLSHDNSVNTAKRQRARSAPLRVSPNSVRPNTRQFTANLSQSSQQQQWDSLLAAALGEQPLDQSWFQIDRNASTTVSPALPKRNNEERTLTKPVRKPHGYWNDLANVERELLVVNAELGRPSKKIVPRLSEMRELGRGDLVAAISKHGGVKKVAETLRWGRGGKTRRARSAQSGCETNTSSKSRRQKILRRPKSYWDDVERVKCEIGAFIDEYGVKGVMPTQRQFYLFQRADLVQAASRHGGLRLLAQMMGLRCRRVPRKKLYWKDFEVLKKALIEFSEKHCPGRMPTGEELGTYGASAITNAIAAHGGFPEVARKCGLVPRNTRSQGAPVTWDENRLRRELYAFTMAFLPEQARDNVIPSERQLRKYGRNDLSYAINKYGGFAKVAKVLGLKQRRNGVFSSKKRLEEEAKERKLNDS